MKRPNRLTAHWKKPWHSSITHTSTTFDDLKRRFGRSFRSTLPVERWIGGKPLRESGLPPTHHPTGPPPTPWPMLPRNEEYMLSEFNALLSVAEFYFIITGGFWD